MRSDLREKDRFIIDVIFFGNRLFEGSEELALGIRELRRRLRDVRRWYHVDASDPEPVSGFPQWSDADHFLVILETALLVSDNLLPELVNAVSSSSAARVCVLPCDPRGHTPGVDLNYATRSGFEAFTARLSAGQRYIPYDGRIPWIYLVNRKALMERAQNQPDLSWSDIPALMGDGTRIAQHAFVHSYADYYLNSRREMLRLLPESVRTLLDVGGGNGNFAEAFTQTRGGKATLLEANPRIAEAARRQGLEVMVGDCSTLNVMNRYDCVAMLDVLEHLADPLGVLVRVRGMLRRGGCLLLSVPNVGFWPIVEDLLAGKFEYQPVGILCQTHRRFFTRFTLEALLRDAGFSIERWENIRMPLPAPAVHFLSRQEAVGIRPDIENLETAGFHILARLAEPFENVLSA